MGVNIICFTSITPTIPIGAPCIGDMQSAMTCCIGLIFRQRWRRIPYMTQRGVFLPDGGTKYDFRDPKMWKAPDGTFRCVVGNCAAERDGQILLFSSRDGLDWKYEKVLAVNHGRFGKAWECPDFFELMMKRKKFLRRSKIRR